ncbi:MAG TPA: winged helix-turn-helix domain-containing protein [Ktedonobacterales bacterium]|nr:winged helix-turn-helix domain-containing protein [Ktedonobacterales bacterium]
MDYTTTIDSAMVSPILADEDVMLGDAINLDRDDVFDISMVAPRPLRNEARYRGLAMDMLSGAVRWRGEAIRLGSEDRQLLAILLTRAGRFVGADQLARQLGVDAAAAAREVERRVTSLRDTLQASGVRCLPRRADGVGYILWA